MASVTPKSVSRGSLLAVKAHFMILGTCLPAVEEGQPHTCMAPSSRRHLQVTFSCPQEIQAVLSVWTFPISKVNLILLADTVRAVQCLRTRAVLTFPD